MALDPARIPQSLKDAYAKGACGVYVGAGASKPAGLPMWSGMLEAMLKRAIAENLVNEAEAKEYERLLASPGKHLMVASGLKEVLGRYFDDFIKSTFVTPKPKPTDLHRGLVKLPKLQFVITTNYDALIERAYQQIVDADVTVCTFKDVGAAQSALFNREFFILKAHGDATKIGNGIVMTDADYRELLYRQRAYQAMLATMFTVYTIVFVGTSMADPELQLLLGYIADVFLPTSGPQHFALMASEDMGEVERGRWRKDFNLNIIPISKDNDYAEATEFIEALSKI
jgi:hypothetical protein